MANTKDFYIKISFSGRLGISVDAVNEEEVKKKVHEAMGTMSIESKDKNVFIDTIEWDLIDKEQQGNIAIPFVRDIEITED